jgi:hypothetical protein
MRTDLTASLFSNEELYRKYLEKLLVCRFGDFLLNHAKPVFTSHHELVWEHEGKTYTSSQLFDYWSNPQTNETI